MEKSPYDAELKEISCKLIDCLQFMPTIQNNHFGISAVNNIGLRTIGLFQNDFFNMDLLELDPNITTNWKISDELVYPIVFRGVVDIRLRKEDASFKRTLRDKSVKVERGVPFLFQTCVEKCSILLIGFKKQRG